MGFPVRRKPLLASCQNGERGAAKNRAKFPCRRLFFGDSYMATTAARPMTAEEKKVIFASSLGNVFEWYDFYL